MQPGQFLVKGNDKRKIYFVNEFIIGFEGGYLEAEIRWMKIEHLRKEGWTLLEEPWRPSMGESYYTVRDFGKISPSMWSSSESDKFRLSIKNVFPTYEDAEAYKQKLIERMGIKE